MQYDKTPFGNLEARRAALDAQKENSGRLAYSFAVYTTTGRGEVIVDAVFGFGCAFIAEPTFLSGAAFEPTGPDLVPGHYPRINAGVYDWQIDGKGMYTGAWVYFCIDTTGPGVPATTTEPAYVIHHHLAWLGIALKNVPGYVIQAGASEGA